MEPKSKVIAITGMHRSGTSLLANLLNQAGLSLGEKLLGPMDSNPKGHFEDYDFLKFHKELLAFNRQTWDGSSTQTN